MLFHAFEAAAVEVLAARDEIVSYGADHGEAGLFQVDPAEFITVVPAAESPAGMDGWAVRYRDLAARAYQAGFREGAHAWVHAHGHVG